MEEGVFVTSWAASSDASLPISRADWERVPLSRRTPMQHFIWIQACSETLYRNDKAHLITVSDADNNCCGGGAFAKRGIFPPRLFLMGAEELGEPVDIVCANQQSVEALVRKILKSRMPLRLGHYPAHSPFVSELKAQARRTGIVLSIPVNASPFIQLDESWKHPETHFSSRRRSDFHRMNRRAQALGEVKYEIITPMPKNVDQILDQAIAVEAKSWKSRSRTALAFDHQQQAFFRRYAKLASRQQILKICLMKIDGRIAAMQIAVECDNAFWLFKIGYDECYAACSPGNLLMLETVRYAAEKGLSAYEFLGKSASWTKVWTQTERPNIRLRYYPHSISGYIALSLDAMALAVRRTARLVQRVGIWARG